MWTWSSTVELRPLLDILGEWPSDQAGTFSSSTRINTALCTAVPDIAGIYEGTIEHVPFQELERALHYRSINIPVVVTGVPEVLSGIHHLCCVVLL